MAQHIDNPAGRLLEILRKAKSTADKQNALLGWAHVFDLIPVDSVEKQFEVLHRLIETHRLIDQVEESIQKVEEDEDRDSFLRPLPRVRQAIPMAEAENTPFLGRVNQVTESDLVILDFCSRHLHKTAAEPIVDAGLLEELDRDISELFSAVTNQTAIDPELKLFLLSELETLRRGVQEYRIGGIDRLRNLLGNIIGAAMVNQDVMQGNKEADELKQFIEVTSKLMSIITFAWKTTKAIETVKSVLPLLVAGHSS